jgi:hypothetical protein
MNNIPNIECEIIIIKAHRLIPNRENQVQRCTFFFLHTTWPCHGCFLLYSKLLMSSSDDECCFLPMLNFKLELVYCISPILDDEASFVDSSDGLLHNKLQHGFCLIK